MVAPRLLLVSPPTSSVEEVGHILPVAATTVDLLLLRWPGLTTAAVVHRIEQLLAAPSRPPLAVHARFDVALAMGLSGVHLPESGLDSEEVRRQAPKLCIGVSRHDARGLLRGGGADYATLGPFAPTASKPGARAMSPTDFEEACRSAPLPVLALGGVDATSASRAFEAGAHGVALIGGVFGQPDPAAALRALRGVVDRYRSD